MEARLGRNLALITGALPKEVRRAGYDRSALRAGMAHVGVGAFHRCHQAEYTDDVLEQRFDRWGVIGINVRAPLLADTLGRQDGLYTRILRRDGNIDARVIGCVLQTVDSQESPEPALRVLAAPDIDVVTLTITEKGYCHKPARGELDPDRAEVAHDLSHPEAPLSVPGLIARALELRMQTHGRPLTIISCDNIPANGVILGNVVGAMMERRDPALARWAQANAAFPSTMVDRIVPATAPADLEMVEQNFGYRDLAVVGGEPYRAWIIEERFAGRVPRWDLAGAQLAHDVRPFELIKMRVLNAAQTSLAYLGLLAGHEHTSDDMTDPLLVAFVRRMLVEESLPTLPQVPGISPLDYVEQSLERLRNKAIRHRNHQIATDGSQKIVQRLLNPIRERLRRRESVLLLSVVVAAWMVYLILPSKRFGGRWTTEDPYGARIAGIAERIGRDSEALATEILAINAIFDRELAERAEFRSTIARHLDQLLSDEPMAYLRQIMEQRVATS